MSGSRPRKLVVAGLLADRQGRVLVTQRRADQVHPLEWELPGGKIEPGEAPAAALVRELDEELGVGVAVGPIWEVLFHAYPEFDVLMLVYPARIERGEPFAREVADLVFCPPSELERVALLPADRPLIARLLAEGLPAFLAGPPMPGRPI